MYTQTDSKFVWVHWHRLLLLSLITLIFTTGLLMVFNTSSALLLGNSQSTHGPFLRHLFYGLLAILGGCWSYRLGYRKFLSRSVPLLIFVSFMLLLVFCPGIGERRNGSARWISLSSLTFQPSELAKLVIPIFAIRFLSRGGHFLWLVAILPPILMLILFEPDNGCSAIIFITLFALCFVARVRLRYWLLPTIMLGAFFFWAAFQTPYVSKRVEVYLNPGSDLLGKGHQPYQAKIAAGSGGGLGRGIGMSMQKFAYLPESQNDYIAAIFAEECGFAGILLLVSLYMTVSAIGILIAHRAADSEGMQLAAVLTFLIAIQVFLNLGVVSGLLPSTGLNLPFFSQGGSSLIANGIAMGILLDIDRASARQQEGKITCIKKLRC